MQQPFLTGKQPILTGVLFLFLIPITKLYSSIWTQSVELHPDRYQYERAKRFNVSKTGIRTALIRLKISYKKNMESP
jgi:hypothetical protein